MSHVGQCKSTLFTLSELRGIHTLRCEIPVLPYEFVYIGHVPHVVVCCVSSMPCCITLHRVQFSIIW